MLAGGVVPVGPVGHDGGEDGFALPVGVVQGLVAAGQHLLLFGVFVAAATAGGAEIYQWLPFTAADLSGAAQTTVTFAKDYSTWSYTESTTEYAAKMAGLVTSQELATLTSGYSTAGVAGPRVTDKQVSTGTGTIDSIRSFGTNPVSITFVVTINQQVTSTQPATTAPPQQYAVTVVSSGGTWQVNDLELSQLGNT